MDARQSEREFWEKVCAGEAEAFANFFSAHFSRLRCFLRHYLGDPQGAEEVAQEAFAQLWQRGNGFNAQYGTLPAYLYGIAKHRAASWKQQQPTLDPANIPETATTTEQSYDLADLLARLEPEERALLWLRETEGYTYAELAEILGIPLGTVKSRLFAARENLRLLWRGKSEKQP